MKTIYINSDFKCHIHDDGTMTAVETDFFDSKCDALIEGYRFIPSGKSWTREDGIIFYGEMITPWRDYSELDAAKRQYERQLLAETKNELAELDAALLDAQYNMLMEDL